MDIIHKKNENEMAAGKVVSINTRPKSAIRI